jgi:hypothetical protein
MIHCWHRAGFGPALLLALAGLCVSCGSETGPPPTLEVEYSRCRAVYLPGPVCTLWKSRRFNLWVKTEPGATVEIQAGDQALAGEVEELRGGRLYRLSIPPHASAVTVSARSPDGTRSASWSLVMTEMAVPAWEAEIDQLQSSDRGREEALKRLRQLLRTAARKEQGPILWSLANIAFTYSGSGEAERYLKQGIAVDRAENCLSCEVEKATLLARLYLEQGRFGDARQTLESLKLPPEAPAESRYRMGYYRGILALRTGDYRLALEQLREAAGLAEKVRMSAFRWKIEQVLASLLQDLGRSQEASALFARLQSDPHPETPCDMGDLLTNRSWAWLLAREGEEKAEDPIPLLKEAQAVYDGTPACTVQQRFNARLNLAFAYLQADRWREARQVLEAARPLNAQASLRQLLWWFDLEGRTAIAEGQPASALRLYEELQSRAERALSLEGRFRAALGRARAHLALGRRSAALVALAEADRRIDEEAWQVPAHEGRDTLVAQREAATRLYLSLLLEEGDRQGAFNLARRARTRLLRQFTVRDRLAQLKPEEQERWDRALASYQKLRDETDRDAAEEWLLPGNQRKLAREDLVSQLAKARADLDRAVADLGILGENAESRLLPPKLGEVMLVYHRLPEGWVGFASDERGIAVNRFELPDGTLDPESQASLLLKPFHSILERAKRVRVLPYGRLRSIDFHILPFGGEPLMARRLVVYGLDLPVRPAPAPPGGRVALLVSDPWGDLPAARREAKEVAAAVRAWGPDWTLKLLDGTAAKAEAVRAELPRAAFFHYAGHGTFAGFAGWDSVLELADGTRLTLGDLQALRQAPTWVVLSSCDAGRSSEQAPGEGIGLAHAFLLAGSQAVVAATRDVPDRTARDLVSELYRGWHPGVDLPRQFQRAQWACLQRHEAGADCESFRLLEP